MNSAAELVKTREYRERRGYISYGGIAAHICDDSIHAATVHTIYYS